MDGATRWLQVICFFYFTLSTVWSFCPTTNVLIRNEAQCACCKVQRSKDVHVNCADCNLESIPTCLDRPKEVQRLDLSRNLLKTLENLTMFPGLRELNVSENQLEDITELKRMRLTNLTTITMNSNFLSDVSPLATIPSLTEIDLSDNCLNLYSDEFSISNATLSGLRILRLKSCCIKDKTLHRVIPVQSFKSLRHLDLSSNGGITSLSFIGCNLSALQTLRVARNPVRNLSTLFQTGRNKHCVSDMPQNLTELDLQKTLITNLSPLITKNVSGNIKRLHLGSLVIWQPHLGAFFNSSLFPNLERLSLPFATFLNRSMLSSCNLPVKLKELDMSGILLSNLSFLAGASELEILRLSHITGEWSNSNRESCRKVSLNTLTRPNLRHLRHLDLSYSCLTDVNQLSNLSSQMGLKFLDLTGTTTNGLDFIDFSKWKNLNMLNISQTGVLNITDKMVPSSLQHLNASHNPLHNFTSTASKLRSVDVSAAPHSSVAIRDWQFLHNNRLISHLHVNGQLHFNLAFLQYISTLKSLHIQDTRYFCDNKVHKATDVRWIEQSHNINELNIGNTCFVNFGLLSNLTNLTYLIADGNGIANIDGVERMTNLEVLDLGENPSLTNVSALQGNPSLSYLDLKSTGIGGSLQYVIATLPKLVYLSVSHTKVTAVEDVIGSCNSTKPFRLRQLELDQNRITVLQPYVFDGMNKLHVINMSSCSLKTLPVGAFAHLRSLRYLDVSNNSDMQSVQSKAIHSCSNLKGVWLTNNPITYFDPDNFQQTPNFRFLSAYQCAACCIAFSGGQKKKLPKSVPSSNCQCDKELAGTASCRNLVSQDGLEAVMGLESALAIFGNIVVMIWRVRLLRSKYRASHPTSWMIITLAIADLCTGIYLLIIVLADQLFDYQYALYAIDWTYSPWCKLASYLAVFSTQLSVSVLITMATTTVLAIRNSCRSSNTKFVLVLLAVEVVAAAAVAAIPLILQGADDPRGLWSGICLPLAVQQELVFEFALPLMTAYTLAILVSATMYIYIAYVTLKHGRGYAQGQSRNQDETYKRLVKRLALIVTVDIICYLPSFIALTVDPALEVISYEVTAYVTILTLPINAATNPILYTLSSDKFVNWVKRRCGSHIMSDDWNTDITTDFNSQGYRREETENSADTSYNEQCVVFTGGENAISMDEATEFATN